MLNFEDQNSRRTSYKMGERGFEVQQYLPIQNTFGNIFKVYFSHIVVLLKFCSSKLSIDGVFNTTSQFP
jgi:hypothetical protein